MFKHGDISTEISKAQFIFALLSFVLMNGIGITIFIVFWGNMLAVFAFVLMFIVGICSLGVLIGLVSDYAYIKDDCLYMSYIFKKSSIDLKDIGAVKLKDDIYHIYDKKQGEVGTINALAQGIDSITNELDRKHVPFI